MSSTRILGGYAAAVLVLAIAVDVGARLDRRAEADRDDEPAPRASKKSEAPAPAVQQPSTSSTRASCERLFDRQKEVAVELAVAFAPQGPKHKKARQKAKAEAQAAMESGRSRVVTACMELPQREVDCVLATDDMAAWGSCGPGINGLASR